MVDRISIAFAESGDKNDVPDDSAGTSMSYEDGWTSYYELAQGSTGALDIDRAQHNQLWNTATGNIKLWQEQGLSDYFSSIDYEVGALLHYTDDENYICHTAQDAGTLPTSHTAFINLKFFSSYGFAVSQLAGGDESLVSFIYEGNSIGSYEFMVYPGDGRIYSVNSATGTFSGDFDPDTGVDSGLSAALLEYSTGDKISSIENGLYKRVTIDISTDADLTITDTQNQYGTVKITDTLSVLTDDINLIVSDSERRVYVINDTNYQIKVKTSAGTGVHVPSGESYSLYCDGANVETIGLNNKITQLSGGLFTSGTWFYLNSLEQSDFDEFVVTSDVPSGSAGGAFFPHSVIDDNPSGWAIVSRLSNSSTTYETYVDYSSDASYTISVFGACSITTVVTTLKEGVTY